MAGTPVRIASVTVEPLRVQHAGHERYRIQLECGCSWWEDCIEPPSPGTIVGCFAKHGARKVASVPLRTPVAADG
jgi:hypothetical protein